METLLLTAVIIILTIFLWWFNRTDPRLPPYPKRPLPIVGHYFDIKQDYRSQFKQWRKQCGDLFRFNIFGTHVVVLNGYDVIKEALVKKADAFSDRTPVFLDAATDLPAKGIMFASGHLWKEQRSVALSILRKFGMGKNILAEKIQEEVSAYVSYLADLKGKPTDIRYITNVSTSNVICSIIIGNRFEYDDKEFQSMMVHLNSTASDQQWIDIINFLPWLQYLPGDLFNAKKIINNVKTYFGMLKRFVREKKANAVDSIDPENFIEAYLSNKNKKVDGVVSTNMNDDNLSKIIIDLFAAGTETTSNTIYWCVLYMLNYPEIQDKVYREIKDIIGTDRIPNIQDRSKLPYFNAVILETQRLASIVPLAVPHICSEEVTLKNYTIPKGTYIVPNIDSVLHDKAIWGEDVMSFKPNRFLDASGKVQDREELIPFGIGRRVCLGEALANVELFLFLSNMFQRFQFLPKDKTPPVCNKARLGLVSSPILYEVRLVDRK
uniref:Cytochrome P450 n=1 Tax=Arion vulgaris TaxID=1028688 RepID=A0A0B7BN75_9EUPU